MNPSTEHTERTAPATDKPVAKMLRLVGWIAAFLVGSFLGLLLCSEASDTAVLPVETFTGVSTGIQNLDAFAVGRFVAVIALICAFVLLRLLFRRPNVGLIAKFIAALAAGAFYSAATLAYLPEIGPLNLITGGSSTVYGKGFSRAGFKKVKPGMTKAEVAALVGEGVDINAIGLEIDHERHHSNMISRWFLSGPGTHENYWQYGVEFTTNGIVDHTWYLFWYD